MMKTRMKAALTEVMISKVAIRRMMDRVMDQKMVLTVTTGALGSFVIVIAIVQQIQVVPKQMVVYSVVGHSLEIAVSSLNCYSVVRMVF